MGEQIACGIGKKEGERGYNIKIHVFYVNTVEHVSGITGCRLTIVDLYQVKFFWEIGETGGRVTLHLGGTPGPEYATCNPIGLPSDAGRALRIPY